MRQPVELRHREKEARMRRRWVKLRLGRCQSDGEMVRVNWIVSER